MKVEKLKNTSEIKNSINALMKRSFLMKDRNKDVLFYLTIQDNLEAINEYLDFLGFKAVIDRELNVIALEYLGSDGIQAPRYKMTVNETKVFMMLVKLFDKKVYDDLVSPDVVKTTIKELKMELDNYELQLIPNYKIITFQKIIENLERYNLVETIEDIKDEHSEIRILPSIKLAMNRESFNQYMKVHEETYLKTEEEIEERVEEV